VFEHVAGIEDGFLVAPGHVLHDIEDAIEAGSGWMIVRKRGVAAEAARDELGSER
jgi:hypothetical protein